ncbi:MAG TPA: hypothetical protein VGK73_11735 [Polyangiaceae bacterium]
MDQRDRDVLGARAGRAPARRRRAFALGFLATVSVELAAFAGPGDVHLLPARVELAPGQWVPAGGAGDAELRQVGAELDATLREAAVDLGLRIAAARPSGPETAPQGSRASLVGLAPEDWVVAAEFHRKDGGLLLRIAAVPPRSRVELVREEELALADLAALDVRTVVMLRDLIEMGRSGRRTPAPSARDLPPAPEEPPRSSGRPVLALSAAIFGGYVGFTIQRASGSADSRLVYPLVALGAGLGLGASLLVADEWNIGTGDAWFISAGALWPTLSGVLIAESYGASPNSQYLYGLSAATAGISLSAVAIAVHPMSEGGAVLAHSGGAFGGVLGAMTQVAIDGETGGSITRGAGYGTGAGVLLGGVLATQVTASPSRVLLVDLSASLGGLAGAALASPLLLTDEKDPTRTRLWIASAGVGTIAGGVIGWYLTAPKKSASKHEPLPFIPYANLAPSYGGYANLAPPSGSRGLELGVRGRW